MGIRVIVQDNENMQIFDNFNTFQGFHEIPHYAHVFHVLYVFFECAFCHYKHHFPEDLIHLEKYMSKYLENNLKTSAFRNTIWSFSKILFKICCIYVVYNIIILHFAITK